ncbi:MAG: leucyl/phenylalanyl-tRNA--protein transferase [Inhella sp.]|uniref:leucyl/phenylalanyl-tRNA--protein transferase n=1 Tax=Inhella sp. TaxID=1921806 RepID=UPI00391B34FB
MIVRLHPTALAFPDPASALGPHSDAPGLLAVGGDLRPERIVAAYRLGIFPWFSEGQPPLWWSPDPRMVLQVADFKLHPSLRKTLRRFLRTRGCAVHVNRDTAAVIRACANTPRSASGGTWIVPDMQAAYAELARRGLVHSVETWRDGVCIGGLYGVRLGRMFFGESMFAHATDASKIALAYLVALCRRDGVAWIDCQQNTRHLASLGAAEVSGAAFRAHLANTVDAPALPAWTDDPGAWPWVLEA